VLPQGQTKNSAVEGKKNLVQKEKRAVPDQQKSISTNEQGRCSANPYPLPLGQYSHV